MNYKEKIIEILTDSKSWSDIKYKLEAYNTAKTETTNKDTVAGKLFEYFAKGYFIIEPEQNQLYKNVWLFDEIPLKIKEQLSFPLRDFGIDLLLQDYQQELLQYRTEIEQQKSLLEREIEKLQSQKKSEENSLIKLSQSIKVKKDELTKIQENKDRIIQDFSIIKDVFQGHSSKNNLNDVNSNSFIVEEVINSDCDNVTTIEEFETQLMYQLSNYSLNPKFSKKIIDVISFYNAILIKDVRIGIAIAEATCNARYIIQQVEPDWLHFRDFWDNGLSEIWNSAHNSPNTFHFLLLEDINMSALECYCRPLLDVINGIRKKIPYGQTPFPENLKILATVASFNEPEIGLPIYKNTIEDWGAVCFRGNIKENFEPISKPVSKLLPTGFFHEQIIDEFDKCNILNDVNAELDNIFEV